MPPESPSGLTIATDVSQPRLGRGIASRYLGYVLGALLLVLLGFSTVVVWHQLSRETDDLADSARAQADFLGSVSPEAVFFRDYLTLETLVRQTNEDPDVVYVVVIDSAGRSMTRYVNRDDPMIASALRRTSETDPQSLANIVQESSVIREVRQPIISEGVLLGEIRLGYSIASARQRAVDFAGQAALATGLLAIMLVALTALVFEWQIRRPLMQLFLGANALAAGDLAQRVPVQRRDEIGTVHRAFNHMADELERTIASAQSAQESAEDATQAKTEFLANMSHEIRTPLNAILGLTEVVLDTELSDDQQDLLQTVQRSGSSLLGIINDILCLSKIEAGRLDLEAEPFALRSCLNDIRDMFTIEAQRKGLGLELVVDSTLPEVVAGDETRLRQILVNLLGNAVKFTEHGEIGISVEPSGGLVADKNTIHFVVRDTGVGIDKETLEHLFEPFSQADASTTRKYGGTGLGLTICRRLVDLMAGELSVTSTVGEGSEFSFHVALPSAGNTPPQADNAAARREPAPSVDTELNAPSGEGEGEGELRLLLAEDNVVNQMVALHMLKRLGYGADVACNGIEASEMAAVGSYDLIFMDIQMPQLDGVGAMRRIRQEHSAEGCPRIIALTANAVEGDREHYLDEGMDGYLSKPMRIADLAEAIDEARLLSPRFEPKAIGTASSEPSSQAH